jgi:hypothetical protein
VAVACAVNENAWHKRLGHVNASPMAAMSRGAVDIMRIVENS